MEQFVPVLGQWLWWIVAGVLLILELTAPGVFFIWLAIAAALTGVADLMLGLSWQGELLIFAVFAVFSVAGGRALFKRGSDRGSDHPTLNRRQKGFVGQSYTLQQPIVDGRGKLIIEDSVWEVRGPDLPAGARVKVTGTDDMRLVVVAV